MTDATLKKSLVLIVKIVVVLLILYYAPYRLAY
jgi:hypothetical protein